MKLSVSLPDEDVAVLDEFARVAGLSSRSAALRRAIALLRLPRLERDYEAAWSEWESAGEQDVWDVAIGDGTAGAPR